MGRRDARDDPRVRRPVRSALLRTPFAKEGARLMRSLWMLVAGLVLVLVGTAAAQAPRDLDPVVVTATKTETPQERLGAAVTVVTEEEIQEKNYATLEEALRHVPGV